MPPRKPAEEKILSRRVLVNVMRDQTAATPRIVWLHEVPILEAVFGEGNVRHVEAEAMDEGYSGKPSPDLMPFNKKQDAILPPSATAGLGFVFVGDPRSEYERLCEVYGQHPEVRESMCEHVYGRFQNGQFARVIGSPVLADLPDAQLVDLAKGYGASPEQIAEAVKAEKVLELAESLGVQVG